MDLKFLNKLRKCFADDIVCLYYHGVFDDTFIDKIIDLSNQDINKYSKRRMIFLVTESFQNIVRHSGYKSMKSSNNLFGIRRFGSFVSIFSSNIVDGKSKSSLVEKLCKLDEIEKSDLDLYYREILGNSNFSNKGGAGLGLIEMARKSGRKLQYNFFENKNNTYSFNMQIDLKVDIDLEDDEPLDIDENVSLHELIAYNKIIFLMKTDFSDDLMSSLVSVVDSNTNKSEAFRFLIYHTAVELIQNIFRHVKVVNGNKDGLFCLLETKGGYFLCTGNFIDDDSNISNIVDEINSKSIKDLTFMYRKNLLKSISNNSNCARIGLIDLKRSTGNEIKYHIDRSNLGLYLVIGVEVKLN